MGKTGSPTPWARAVREADLAASMWKDVPGVLGVQVCGSVLRGVETVSDVDMLVVTEAKSLLDVRPDGHEDWHVTPSTANRWLNGVWIEAWRCHPGAVGPMRVFLTGPADLNVYMRRRAQKQGLSLSQYGLFGDAGARYDQNTEESVFALVGVPYMVPVERSRWRELL